jgi:hypothetical protein
MSDRKDTVRRFALRLGRPLVAAASAGVLVVASCGEPQLAAEPVGPHHGLLCEDAEPTT